MSNHTPEPLRVIRVLQSARRMAAEAHATPMALSEIDGAIEHAKACVNACAGIPTEALEGGCLAQLLKHGHELMSAHNSIVSHDYDTPEGAKVAEWVWQNFGAALAPFLKGDSDKESDNACG